MLNLFICGTFHREEDQDELRVIGAGASSRSLTLRRPSARRRSFCRAHNSHHSKNPYSTRGLDTFEALLADLEEKRKKIYTSTDPGNISFVRFIYTSSNDCVPIVVKLKDKNNQPRSPPREEETSEDKHLINCDHPGDPHQSASVKRADGVPKAKSHKKKGLSWRWPSLDRWRQPSYYMPAAIILILVFLAVFGRFIAILCTSIGWYIVPALKGEGSIDEKATKPEKKKMKKKKKELTRRSSENKIMATRQSPDRSPEQHRHRSSW